MIAKSLTNMLLSTPPKAAIGLYLQQSLFQLDAYCKKCFTLSVLKIKVWVSRTLYIDYSCCERQLKTCEKKN